MLVRVIGRAFSTVMALGAALGCSGERTVNHRSRGSGAGSDSGGSLSTGGTGGSSSGGSGCTAGSAGTIGSDECSVESPEPGGPFMLIDDRDCATRKLGDCSNLCVTYSQIPSDAAAAIAHCSAFNAFDGCQDLYFRFDDDGCASAVGPGPAGWDGDLPYLRGCLTEVFTSERFPCLASKIFSYHASCFIP